MITNFVQMALEKGEYCPKQNVIEFKTVTGWSKINMYFALTGEELAALTDKFGSEVIAACKLRSNDAAAEKLAAAVEVTYAGRTDSHAAKMAKYAPKGKEYGSGIRHGFGD